MHQPNPFTTCRTPLDNGQVIGQHDTVQKFKTGLRFNMHLVCQMKVPAGYWTRLPDLRHVLSNKPTLGVTGHHDLLTTKESTMMRLLFACILSVAVAHAVAQDSGMVTRASKHSVPETVARLQAAIESSGVYKVFYQLDHSMNAEKEAGAKLPPSYLILFGNPKGGAPLIKEAPTLALDLPNRALIWQDSEGKVWVTYNDVASLFARHGLKRAPEQVKAIEARQAALFDRAVE